MPTCVINIVHKVCVIGGADSQQYSILKALSDLEWTSYPSFVFTNLIIFICGFSTRVICAFLTSETIEKLTDLNTFRAR